jgi:hypothetical protein
MRVMPVAAVLLSGMLSGCALPPILIASVLSDGALMASTGKGSTDLAMSAMSGKDCLTSRMLKGDDVCREEKKKAAAVVVAAPDQSAPNQAAPADDAHPPPLVAGNGEHQPAPVN